MQAQPPKSKRPVPSLSDLKQQKARADSTATGRQPKPGAAAPVLTPEEKAEKEKKEQEKLKEITDDWKKDLTPEEQDESMRAINRARPGIVVNGVVQPCPNKKKGLNRNCVDPTSQASFTPELKEAIKKKAGGTGKNAKDVKINYDKLDGWEKTYSGAYVPWWPHLNNVTKDIGPDKEHPHKVNVIVPSTKHELKDGKQMLKGGAADGGNSSGVTIGTGVDLGAQSEKGHANALRDAAKESGLLTDAEVESLITKLKPYYGLKRTDACQFLRKNPLTLTQKETDLVNLVSLSDYTTQAIKGYEAKTGKNWNDLSEEEQTLMLSHQYHHGHIGTTLANDVGNGSSEKVLTDLKGEREQGYMSKYYNDQAAEKAKTAKPDKPASTTTSH